MCFIFFYEIAYMFVLGIYKKFLVCRAADMDTLRILVATDCHVGYLESDEIRRYDSFNAFEEICSIASQRQVCIKFYFINS